MNQKLKALGLAFAAALVLTAVMASTAMAHPGFTSEVENPTLHGVQEGNHEFKAGEGFGAITCSTATFSGTGEGTHPTSVTVSPTYSGCKDSFGRTVHVVTNSLHYIFTVDGTDAEGTPKGSVHVTGHIELTITTGGTHCTVTISAEQTLNGITYHTTKVEPTPTHKIRVTTNASGVKSTTSGGFFVCGIANGEHTEGTYTGTTIMEGKVGGEEVGLGVDAH
jgi:hypothetical protein